MTQLKLLRCYCLVVLALSVSRGSPASGRCVEETLCSRSLEEFHYKLANMPKNLNQRSIAAWVYEPNTDLNRVPQVIHEAKCLSSHSCGDVESPFGLETIPISVRMPVLRKSHGCPTYSLEYQSVAIACICATPRRF
ncbi:interleukin-25-like [Anguilla anguilla]|uniref:interleukin-25-like n=1 Tax=Anguilla anguilla TaxID=7936 RepID=UPI0015ACD8EC|nr:interleukin-25-like [Anguilla anguilla]